MSRTASEGDIEGDNTTAHPHQTQVHNYKLNVQKSLMKKLHACDRDEAIAIEHTHGGTKALFQTGQYEQFKSAVSIFYQRKRNIKSVTSTTVTDNTGSCSGHTYKVIKPDTYTLNLYHTTSSILVNGKGETTFIDKHLPQILRTMKGGKELNQLLKASLLATQSAFTTTTATATVPESSERKITKQSAETPPQLPAETESSQPIVDTESQQLTIITKSLQPATIAETLQPAQSQTTSTLTLEPSEFLQLSATDNLHHTGAPADSFINNAPSTSHSTAKDIPAPSSVATADTITANCTVGSDADTATTALTPNPFNNAPTTSPDLNPAANSPLDSKDAPTLSSQLPAPTADKDITTAALSPHSSNNDSTTSVPAPSINSISPPDHCPAANTPLNSTVTIDDAPAPRSITTACMVTATSTVSLDAMNPVVDAPAKTSVTLEVLKALEGEMTEMKTAFLRLENTLLSRSATESANFRKSSVDITTCKTTKVSTNDAFSQTDREQPPTPHTHNSREEDLLLTLQGLEERLAKLEKERNSYTTSATTQRIDSRLSTLEKGKCTPTNQPSFASVARHSPQGDIKVPRNDAPQRTKVSPENTLQQMWFSGKDNPLSNLFEANIRVYDRWLPSAEHAYQLKKCEIMNNKNAAREILYANTSKSAQSIGKTVRTTPIWADCKRNVMLEILRAKAEHCIAYRTALINIPHNATIHEDTTHPFWGGKSGCANNLGQVHMIIKKELHDKQAKNLKPNNTNQSQIRPHTYTTGATKKLKVCILGDSNTKFLDPAKMTQKHTFSVKPTTTAEQAAMRMKDLPAHDIVVLHVGTNDLCTKSPKETAHFLMKAAGIAEEKGSKILISKLLPRENTKLQEKVKETNKILMQSLKNNPNIRFTENDAFYDQQKLNTRLYQQEYRGGTRLPLLHVNWKGLTELSRQIQTGIYHISKK